MAALTLWLDESESEKARCFVLGGVLVEENVVPELVNKWRRLKSDLSLKEDAEIKWNLKQNHPTRKALEKSGYSTRDLCEQAVECLATNDQLSLIIAVMFDERQRGWWDSILGKKPAVRDFYCEGLKYILQRTAEEVVESNASSCLVVCDTPELGKQEFQYGSSIRVGPKAAQQAYAEWYSDGVGVGPGRKQCEGSLRDARFHPSILLADATFHDVLQMADITVGATREWVVSVLNKTRDSWITQQMQKLAQRLRNKHGQPSFWGDGLVLWPYQKELWEALKWSIQSREPQTL